MYVCVFIQLLSCVQFSVTPWIEPARLLCPWEFSKQEYWSGLPLATPGDLPDPGIELTPLMSHAL